MTGKLIVFEGPDGVGKTTQVEKLCEYYRNKQIPFKCFSFPGKAEGTLGHHIYKLHHQYKDGGSMHPASLQVLHIAAHIDQIENYIMPALEFGETVILDRFWWSTWVYGLVAGVEMPALSAMIKLEAVYWRGLVPDVLFLLHSKMPLRNDVDDADWKKLMGEYLNLSKEQGESYLVCQIDTNCSANTTFDKITKNLT